MKKVKTDDLRAEYRREDFGEMVRGKYAAQMSEASNVIVLDPDVADAFPNGQAVNAALRSLLELAKLAAWVAPPTANPGQESSSG